MMYRGQAESDVCGIEEAAASFRPARVAASSDEFATCRDITLAGGIGTTVALTLEVVA